MSDERELLVSIKGIEMQMEAWELIRLFFDADAFRFVHNGARDFEGKCRLLKAEVTASDGDWCCKAAYYSEIRSSEDLEDALNGRREAQLTSRFMITEKDRHEPGRSLLKCHKILVGSCLYAILSELKGKALPYGSLTGVRPVKLAGYCLIDGMDRDSAVSLLKKATYMSEKKASLLFDIAVAEQPYARYEPDRIHLYIGIPFCASRCLYCSFTAYSVQRFQSLVPGYLEALYKEIDFTAEWIKENSLRIGSAYIGGGTPTALDAASLDALLRKINASFDLTDAEFTVEAGRPDTLSEEKFHVMLNNQVKRISINPQTMNAETLKKIGRSHTPKDIEEKFALARRAGFANINMDIIAGLPDEDFQMFSHTLDKIGEMSPESLTVHTMAVKRASRLSEGKEPYIPAPDETVEEMIEAARLAAHRMGMKPYYLYRQKNILANLENTGYAKPGAECLYNIQSMEEKETIVALGAGAISKFVSPEEKKMERIFNVKEVTQYIGRIDEMLQRKKPCFDSIKDIRGFSQRT